jgi:hypothetical protein
MLEHWAPHPKVANWLPKFHSIFFSVLGPIQGHKVEHLLVTWGRLKRLFSISALTPCPLGPISSTMKISRVGHDKKKHYTHGEGNQIYGNHTG